MMAIRRSHRSRGLTPLLTVSVFLTVLLSGCFDALTVPATESNYLLAVNDSIEATASEIDDDLVAITPDDGRVTWEGVPGESRVLMASYTSYAGYDSQVGQTITLPGSSTSIFLWVTSVGEWPDFAPMVLRAVVDPDTRVRQLLGLPPEGQAARFVQFWIDPADLYRPSPDPEITDHEAELSWPVSAVQQPPDQSYQTWFVNREATVYYGSDPYPWTRLGYTYDWGNRRSSFGMSEFVVRQGASVTVVSTQSTLEFLEEQAGQ